MGISLFLASVGLKAGPAFFETVTTPAGAAWVTAGLAITMIPLLATGLFAILVLRMNYVPLTGLLSGSMTDPPALDFATAQAGGEGPSTAYAAVYPLAMILRIMAAQVLAVILC